MDNELFKIINAAFVPESCPQKRRHAEYRKELLTKRLISYIEHQLANQFNAKPIEDTERNGLGEGAGRFELVP